MTRRDAGLPWRSHQDTSVTEAAHGEGDARDHAGAHVLQPPLGHRPSVPPVVEAPPFTAGEDVTCPRIH
ncbi:hypothetical protein [Haladaptatus sp. NG-SE-30]